MNVVVQCWSAARGSYEKAWRELEPGVEEIVRVVITNGRYTFRLQGADVYWYGEDAEGAEFATWNLAGNEWGFAQNLSAWRWDDGEPSQVKLVRALPRDGSARFGVWIPDDKPDPWGIR